MQSKILIPFKFFVLITLLLNSIISIAQTDSLVSMDDSMKQNLFIKIIPDKKNVYEGQQVILYEKFFTKLSIESISFHSFAKSKDYSYTVSRIHFSSNHQIKPTKDTINNKIFMTANIMQHAIYPNHKGTITILPDTAICVVDKPVKKKTILVDQFFGGSYKRVAYIVPTDEAIIQANSLPLTDKPFSGLVGHFKANVSLENDTVGLGNYFYLKVIIIGDGNLNLIDSIPYKLPEGIEHPVRSISDSTYETEEGLVLSRRVFNYNFIPGTEGIFKVSAVKITYFNPDKKKYSDLIIPGFSITVITSKKN
jgi:hypothetical protein